MMEVAEVGWVERWNQRWCKVAPPGALLHMPHQLQHGGHDDDEEGVDDDDDDDDGVDGDDDEGDDDIVAISPNNPDFPNIVD